MESKIVLVKPTDKDLTLVNRELIRIEILHSSIKVVTQLATSMCINPQIDVYELLFPIKHLKRFLLLNGKSKFCLCRRDPECGWANDETDGIIWTVQNP
ncbi:MAG: hypothetical protein PHF92_08265 [Bacteroidales bacterium]|nr:hypothetical protein [Eubacteriales bacterium]MDD4641331.1 hypothetical protein [Bacteroidales bacterium]